MITLQCVTQMSNCKNYNQLLNMSVAEELRTQVPLPEISNDEQAIQLRILRQRINQQDALIDVLRKQIQELQNTAIEQQKKRMQQQKLYNDAIKLIETQKQKIETLRENNESIIHTFEVFQRQFVKRNYKNGINIQMDKEKIATSDGPLFIQLLRNMKSKFVDSVEVSQEDQQSQLNEYYGYFFNQQLDQKQSQFFAEIKQKKLVYSSTSIKNKIRGFGKKHFFNQKYRHYYWFHIMGKPLKITALLYDELKEKCKILREKQEQGKVSLIDRDLNRMDFKLEDQKSKDMKNAVRNCLEMFQAFRPDIGYIQGMSYLAWMLLIRLDQFQSFSCFANLIICDPFVSSLYFFKEARIKKIKDFYEKCMEDKRPKLLKHMKNLEVECQFFIIQWAYTLFTRAFNLRICSKIWDLFLSQGFNVFFKVILVVMDMLQTQVLQINENDKVIQFVRSQTHKIDEVEFLKNLKKQKLPQQLQF